MTRKNRMLPLLAMGAFSLIFSGCSNDIKDIYTNSQQKLQEEAEKIVEQCNNFKNIQVNLTSNVPGMYCSVYTEEPYDENGSLTSAPVLAGLTPISTDLVIGNNVDKLYIVTRKGITEQNVADLNLNLSTTTTRAMTETDLSETLLNSIDQAFPEKKWNLTNSELYFNPDLKITKETPIKLQYVSDGLSNVEGILYMYTYPADKTTPTIDDCTFYGIDQNTGDVIKLEGVPTLLEKELIRSNGKGYNRPLEVSDYIFSNVEEKESGKHRVADMGTFGAGVKVGFCYEGLYDFNQQVDGRNVSMRCSHFSFTTPCLNDANHSLGMTARNDRDFKYTQPTTQGCIKKIVADGKTYFVLGMENGYPDGTSYDADFNDMLCLMEIDPEAVERDPGEPEGLDLETYKYARGYYLFEDNYPSKGDYDFNDVVVQYEIKTYVNRATFDENRNEVKTALLAWGCSMENEFGFYVGDKDNTENGTFHKVFEKIHGYVNVGRSNTGEKVDPSKFQYGKTFTCAGNIGGTSTKEGAMIRPYLKNQPDIDEEPNVIFDNNFTREGIEYPYVLDVPLTTTSYNYTLNFNYTVEKEAGKGFRWCKEGKKITDAYNETPKTLRWYLKGYKDESLLISREDNADDSAGL